MSNNSAVLRLLHAAAISCIRTLALTWHFSTVQPSVCLLSTPRMPCGQHTHVLRMFYVFVCFFFCFGGSAIHCTYSQEKKPQASNRTPFAAKAASYRHDLERGKHSSLQKVSMSSKTSQAHVSCSLGQSIACPLCKAQTMFRSVQQRHNKILRPEMHQGCKIQNRHARHN